MGHPDDTHFHPRPSKWNLTKKPRKKSEKKIKRDKMIVQHNFKSIRGKKEKQKS